MLSRPPSVGKKHSIWLAAQERAPPAYLWNSFTFSYVLPI